MLDSADIQFVSDLVIQAGQIAQQAKSDSWQVEYKGHDDPVTALDRKLDDILVTAIHQRFPNDGIVSEERIADTTQWQRARTWLIDPIDGTRHFIKGDGAWAVMVGLLVDQSPVCGWVYQPAADTLYFGGQRDGAFRRQAGQISRLTAPFLRLPPRIVVGTRDPLFNKIDDLWPGAAIVRRGGMGLKIMAVLEGEADLVAQTTGQSKQWDTAAPLGIARAAGLVAMALDGSPLNFSSERLRHTAGILVGLPEVCRAALEYLSVLSPSE